MRDRRRRRRERGTSRLGLWTSIVLGVLLLVFAGLLEYSRPHAAGEELRFDQFVDLAHGGRIEDARILDEDALVVGAYVRDDGSVGEYVSPLLRHSQADLLELLLTNRIPTTIDQQVGKRVAALATVLLPGLILVVLFAYLIVSHPRGSGLFDVRGGARKVAPDSVGATFDDAAGQEQAVAELRQIAEHLADPGRFGALGAVVPKGVLLYGPPSCGKTLLARALAGEASANFYAVSGSDFVVLTFGEPTTGSDGDLRRVGAIAR